ncbi:MAG: hypothetical protein ACYDCN_11955 [Bacteroidia bacterium]
MNKLALLFAGIILVHNVALAQGLKGDKKKETEKKSEKDDERDNEREHRNASSSSSGEKCFDENTRILNVGIGFGGGNYYASAYNGPGYSYRVSPAFSITYEQAIKKKVGPGYIGVGGYLGYQGSSITENYYYDNNGYTGNYYSTNRWTDIMVAARGAYHWDVVCAKKAELYAGALIGLRIQTWRYTTSNPDPNYRNYYSSNGSVFPTFDIFVGGRYYFTNKIAVFAEVGYGISYITGGISFKF